MTPRDIEKLKALLYEVKRESARSGPYWTATRQQGSVRAAFMFTHPTSGAMAHQRFQSEDEAWAQCMEHAKRHPMTTMADKVRWILDNEGMFSLCAYSTDGGEEKGYFAEMPDIRHPAVVQRWKGVRARGQGPAPEVAVDDLFWKVP